MLRDEGLLSTLLRNILALVDAQQLSDPSHAGASVGGEVRPRDHPFLPQS